MANSYQETIRTKRAEISSRIAASRQNSVILKTRASAASPYPAAGSGRRLVKWTTASQGPSSVVINSVTTLRSRSRDIIRRNAWAVRAIDAYVAEVIGYGIKPQFRHPDPAVRKTLQSLWRRWVDEADSLGFVDFYGMQALVCRSVLEGGECIARFRPRLAKDGLTVPFQIQTLEPEHLPVTMNESAPNGNLIRAGIEFDKISNRVAYHLYREHPEDYLYGAESMLTSRVPASQALLVFKPLRLGQIRGLPWLAPVLVKLYELDKYDDAELVRKATASMYGGFITSPSGVESPFQGVTTTTLNDGNTTAPDNTDFLGLEPGTFVELDAGQTVQFSAPVDVGGMYVEFMNMHLRSIASAVGITFEQLTGDLSKVNFSSSRVGLQHIRRAMEQFQYMTMVYQFCRPIMNYWLETAALSGAIDSTDYYRNRDLYRDVAWRAPRWPYIDPLKDPQSEILQIRALLKSRSASISEQGEDAEQVELDTAADNERADALGLVGDADPRKTSQNGSSAQRTVSGQSSPSRQN